MIINLKSVEFKMRSFATPPKHNYDHPISSTLPRQGDWVCYNCHNLNFSFRKKCNRCKMQTKEQNEQYLPYYYQLSFQFPGQPLQDISNFHSDQNYEPSSPTRSNSFSSIEENLPSVSPLLKRYKLSSTSSEDEDNIQYFSLGCSDENWNSFLNRQEDTESNSLSDSSGGQNYQQYDLLDDQIEQMVTRIII